MMNMVTPSKRHPQSRRLSRDDTPLTNPEPFNDVHDGQKEKNLAESFEVMKICLNTA
jgi:hypothetical protein